MKVVHLSFSDVYGGAARAAYRIYDCVKKSGVNSKLFVSVAGSNDPDVIGPRGLKGRLLSNLRISMSNKVQEILVGSTCPNRSLSIIPSNWASRINNSDFDIVHLHWVQGEMISIRDIGNISKPIVWTLHDMWPISGVNHYIPNEILDTPSIYPRAKFFPFHIDIDHAFLKKKNTYWKRPMHLVTTSDWMTSMVDTTNLMSKWPVVKIPYPLDTQVWKPCNKYFSRQALGIEQSKTVILFGAIGGTNDPRKGFDLLSKSIQLLAHDINLDNITLLLFGETMLHSQSELPVKLHHTGHLSDNISLNLAYNCADLMVVPSRQEAYGQTASEAHACGLPVIAFRIGGLQEVVLDGVTGLLVPPYDVVLFAEAIKSLLVNTERRIGLGLNARRRAVELWNPSFIAEQYNLLYNKITSQNCIF